MNKNIFLSKLAKQAQKSLQQNITWSYKIEKIKIFYLDNEILSFATKSFKTVAKFAKYRYALSLLYPFLL